MPLLRAAARQFGVSATGRSKAQLVAAFVAGRHRPPATAAMREYLAEYLRIDDRAIASVNDDDDSDTDSKLAARDESEATAADSDDDVEDEKDDEDDDDYTDEGDGSTDEEPRPRRGERDSKRPRVFSTADAATVAAARAAQPHMMAAASDASNELDVAKLIVRTIEAERKLDAERVKSTAATAATAARALTPMPTRRRPVHARCHILMVHAPGVVCMGWAARSWQRRA